MEKSDHNLRIEKIAEMITYIDPLTKGDQFGAGFS